ncbi:MAG: hypothetical protein IJS29_09270 [Selenomonadaceae bacterium]|nr:hypothetical protein [Selenomonadaceae bacterium]
MNTKQITAIPVEEKDFTGYRDEKLVKVIEQAAANVQNDFNVLCEEFAEKFRNKKWIYLTREGQSEGVYYVNEIVGLIPDLAVHSCSSAYAYRPIDYNDGNILNESRLAFAGFKGVIPTENEVRRLFNDEIKYFRANDGCIKVKNDVQNGISYLNGGQYYYMWTNNSRKYSTNYYNSSDQYYFWVIPIHRFQAKLDNSVGKIIFLWLKNKLSPRDEEFKSVSTKNFFRMIETKNSFLKITDSFVELDQKKVFDAVKAGQTVPFLPSLDFLNDKTADDEDFEKKLSAELLSCDFNRVQLDRYDAKILTDPNRGHWDLWDLPEDSAYTVTLKNPIYARNPTADINASGIVGIDFGTKSTVVVYENERGKIIPLQVGKGDYSKGVVRENYENPTIIEFRHIKKFLSDYAEREGRPQTSWNDVTVSHNAQSNLLSDQLTDTILFNSFFTEIKQWCGNLEYTTKLRDHDGTEIDLQPFAEIVKDQFNPLEYYAYYLGSYINHMLQPNHIFMKYILSFPVTYERNIRERMLRSFTAGIRKSLPTALLSNAEEMKAFQVVEGTSEPAAYAITALEGFGFMDGEEDNVYYAVFDFGGGTTDFDFGVLKIAEDDDADFYDFVLTHFGAHGDRTLGGENLLKLLAFEVFKANREKLLKPRSDSKDSKAKIPFTWAAEKSEFAGSEGIIRNSQEAALNMYHLIKKLRPVWENPQSKEAQEIFNSGKITTRVFDDAGQEIPNFDLKIGAVNSAQNVDVDATPKKISDDEFYEVMIGVRQEDTASIIKLENWAVAGDYRSQQVLENLSDDIPLVADAFKRFKNKKSAPKVDTPKKDSKPLVDLEKILTDRIRRGVDNFFISMREAFDKVSGGSENGIAVLSDVPEIKIFLAGNSTKSALVKKIFDEYIDYDNGKARSLLGFGGTQVMPRFTLYPPLGTDDAKQIQRENEVEVDENNFAAPTGKTGVAFGLLRCRDGSAVRVVDITPEGKDKKQVPFRYYVGRAKLGKFKVVIDKSAKLGEWYRFIGAKLGVFDLFYTDESVAATNNEPISIAKRLTIHIDADPTANVYVKASTSNTIRYAVSKDVPPPEVEGTPITLD